MIWEGFKGQSPTTTEGEDGDKTFPKNIPMAHLFD